LQTNSDGYASLVINPNYCISEKLLSLLNQNDYLVVCNTMLANHEKGSYRNWSNYSYVHSDVVSPQVFETYKFEFGSITFNSDKTLKIIQDPVDVPEIQKNTIRIQTLDGKCINTIVDLDTIFRAKFNLSYFNTAEVGDCYIWDDSDQGYYKMLPYTHDVSNYNRDAFNIANEPPYMQKTFADDKELASKKLVDFAEQIVSDEDMKMQEDHQDKMRALDFTKKLGSYSKSQIQAYNLTNEFNEKIFRVDVYSEPFAIIDINIQLKYSLRSQKSKLLQLKSEGYNLPSVFSTVEQGIRTFGNILSSQTTTVPFGALRSITFPTKDQPQLRGIFSWIVDKVKKYAGPVLKTISNVTGTISETIEKVVAGS
jgi:hypothetical protein